MNWIYLVREGQEEMVNLDTVTSISANETNQTILYFTSGQFLVYDSEYKIVKGYIKKYYGN